MTTDFLTAHLIRTTADAGAAYKKTDKAYRLRIAMHSWYINFYDYVGQMWKRGLNGLA